MSDVQNAAGDESVQSTSEYDPNIPATWAVRDDVDGWNENTRVYIQAPPSDVPDSDYNFIDAETDNLCVEVFSWGEVNVYSEGFDPSSMECDIRREYDGEFTDTVPLWWITELLVDEGYIDDGELYDGLEQDVQAHSAPGFTPIDAASVSTDEVAVPEDIKEAQWEAYREVVNQYTSTSVSVKPTASESSTEDSRSMNTMDDLDERTARVKFENWYEMNYRTE